MDRRVDVADAIVHAQGLGGSAQNRIGNAEMGKVCDAHDHSSCLSHATLLDGQARLDIDDVLATGSWIMALSVPPSLPTKTSCNLPVS